MGHSVNGLEIAGDWCPSGEIRYLLIYAYMNSLPGKIVLSSTPSIAFPPSRVKVVNYRHSPAVPPYGFCTSVFHFGSLWCV